MWFSDVEGVTVRVCDDCRTHSRPINSAQKSKWMTVDITHERVWMRGPYSAGKKDQLNENGSAQLTSPNGQWEWLDENEPNSAVRVPVSWWYQQQSLGDDNIATRASDYWLTGTARKMRHAYNEDKSLSFDTIAHKARQQTDELLGTRS